MAGLLELIRHTLATRRYDGRHTWSAGNVAFAVALLGAVLYLGDYAVYGEDTHDVGKFGISLGALALIIAIFGKFPWLNRS